MRSLFSLNLRGLRLENINNRPLHGMQEGLTLMSNRFYNQFALSLEKGKTFLFGKVAIGATGAPTLDATNSKGIASITRNSAGKYTIVLQDVYNRFLGFQPTLVVGTGTPAAPLCFVISETVATPATKNIVIQFTAVDGTTATDPASGESLRFTVVLKGSSAQ